MCDNMEKEMVLHPDDEEEQDPTVQFWLYYFISQHHFRMQDIDKAFEWVAKAIAHTPTVLELYIHKAKIMQFAGNRKQAMELTEEARRLDLADRYLNAHASKYIFKVDDTKRAEDTMRMFSREDDNGVINVHEMQTMWYEIHCGKANYRKGDLRNSLKQFSYLEKHCETMMEDCYDFHYYSFRKGTINHYIQMLKFEDNTHTGKWPVRGCTGMLRCLSKIKKMVAANPGIVDETKKEFEEFKTTEEYSKWFKDYEKRDNDDPVQNDSDPWGWELYIKAMETPEELSTDFATKVSLKNP